MATKKGATRDASDNHVWISPTGLMEYGICHARLWWAQRWERAEQEDNFGSQVHRRMEDGSAFDAAKDIAKVDPILRKMRAVENQLAYAVLGREVAQTWELFPGVTFKRVLDALVRLPTGRFAIVDYKSSSKPWKTLKGPDGEEFAPKARTLQATGYTLPPGDGVSLNLGAPGEESESDYSWVFTGDNWPDRVLFINAPEQGDARWFITPRTDDAEAAFLRVALDAAHEMQWLNGGKSPPIPRTGAGDACDGRWTGPRGQTYGWACPWLEMCWEMRGWKKLYKRKERA